jgi:hypothetical protein
MFSTAGAGSAFAASPLFFCKVALMAFTDGSIYLKKDMSVAAVTAGIARTDFIS